MSRKKKCSVCGEMKSRELFQDDKKNQDGKRSYCKQCSKIYEQMKRFRKIDLYLELQHKKARLAEMKQENDLLRTKYATAKANWASAVREIQKLYLQVEELAHPLVTIDTGLQGPEDLI